MTDIIADDSDDDQRPGMRTRKKNKFAHPGVVDMEPKPRRRTSAQVKADNEKKEREAAEAAAEIQERAAKVARIEEEMATKQKAQKEQNKGSRGRGQRGGGQANKAKGPTTRNTRGTTKRQQALQDLESGDIDIVETATPASVDPPQSQGQPGDTVRARGDESDTEMPIDQPWGAGVHIERALTEEPDGDLNAGTRNEDEDEMMENADMDVDEGGEGEGDEEAGPSQAASETRVDDDVQVAESAQGTAVASEAGKAKKGKKVQLTLHQMVANSRKKNNEANSQEDTRRDCRSKTANAPPAEVHPAPAKTRTTTNAPHPAPAKTRTAESSGSEISGITSWRKQVVPGGEHIGEVSEDARASAMPILAVRPVDSVSQAASSGSSVISSAVHRRTTTKAPSTSAKAPSTSAKAPSTSALASSSSVVSSALSVPPVNILPASPKKRPSETKVSTNEGIVSVRMRNTSQSLQVADEDEDGKGRRSRSGSHSSAKSGRGSKFTNKDLPFSLGNDKTWRNVFCHTVFDYAGTLEDPWTMKTKYIQDVWKVVYPDLDYTVEANGAVFAIVSQRLCEWRGKFAREALVVVKEHFESDTFQTEDGVIDKDRVKDFVEDMLEYTKFGYRFIYQDTVNQTFAIHLQSIEGSLGLKSFLAPKSGDIDDLRPIGALMLSCIAVQRALKLFESGSCTKTVTDFSADQALKEQHKFANFIKIKSSSWDKIILAAKEHVPSGVRRSSTSRPQSRTAMNETEPVAMDALSRLSNLNNNLDFLSANLKST
ncbi:hypothetical protein SCHPADRAFT_893912 [Schizopora paradoxa]|uniref:Uncharacterized protein n=1 Tax=Schizopora paradoxa TaxID=27342 RepID=A0A0H2R991_9AGAM|nr:hypothetical protein SCHPADRAFT_893912 [Schizopora paradoxa]